VNEPGGCKLQEIVSLNLTKDAKGIYEQVLNGLSALLSGIAGIVSGSFPSTSRNNPPFPNNISRLLRV